MKATAVGELLLLLGLLALGWLVYVQQEQLVTIELELDKIRGALEASTNGASEEKPKARPKASPRPKPSPTKRGSGHNA